ncbi:MAG: hypothetical protein CDV28_11129 [Candidatus Electronema aureum]|uniref:Uncharacterized protein n=1 Tax=Candidatus Electronema aureum TaxID=2005002 RepID=A0A521G252_9BACT|nr:MAG: hypothetical protein CDV28_11129 [Candidatus Electronema aureum]
MIIWGTKRVEKKVGYVADFCPICRTAKSHHVRKISMVPHFYYVGLGAGKMVGFLARCMDCGLERYIDTADYVEMIKTEPVSIEELIRATYPSLRTVYKERLELEETLRRSPFKLDSKMRRSLIRNVFDVLSPSVEEVFANGTPIDAGSGLCMCVTVLVLFAFVAVGAAHPDQKLAVYALGILTAISMVATVVSLATSTRGHMAKMLSPLLVRSLRPLRPKQEELEAVLSQLKTMDLRIGKKLKAQWIMDSLEETSRHKQP